MLSYHNFVEIKGTVSEKTKYKSILMFIVLTHFLAENVKIKTTFISKVEVTVYLKAYCLIDIVRCICKNNQSWMHLWTLVVQPQTLFQSIVTLFGRIKSAYVKTQQFVWIISVHKSLQ